MISISDIVVLLKNVLAVKNKIKELSDASRKAVSEYLISNSECLITLAKKRKNGERTHSECSELGIYVDRIPQDLVRILGEDFVKDLVRKFHDIMIGPVVYATPPVNDDDDISTIEIESLAGELKGLANTL